MQEILYHKILVGIIDLAILSKKCAIKYILSRIKFWFQTHVYCKVQMHQYWRILILQLTL